MNTNTATATTTRSTDQEMRDMLREMLNNWQAIDAVSKTLSDDPETVYQMTKSVFDRSLGL